MDARHIEKVYSRSAPVYDFFYGWIFAPGRARAIELLELKPNDHVLEMGIGTGLLLPYYPQDVRLTGIDLTSKMLEKTEERVQELELTNTELRRMDATHMDFPDNSFDKAIGAYFLSAVPDPAAVAREASRVVKPGGLVVFLNHFKSELAFMFWAEKVLSPLGYLLGFHTTLELRKVLDPTPLKLRHVESANLFRYWKIVVCVNAKDEVPDAP
jgi:phosphatidylethanolamine/phosphatidyl-N-methylethanolamine N-methyltransferase